MKDDQEVSGDVESGTIDSGLSENVVVQKTERATPKVRNEDSDDPKSDINTSGVAVNQIDD